MQNCSTFVNYWKCFFPFFFFESISMYGSIAAPVNQWLLISPVESVGDDAVVHKLPSTAKFNRDVELEKREADGSEMQRRIPLTLLRRRSSCWGIHVSPVLVPRSQTKHTNSGSLKSKFSSGSCFWSTKTFCSDPSTLAQLAGNNHKCSIHTAAA